jgi:hypothetical protein
MKLILILIVCWSLLGLYALPVVVSVLQWIDLDHMSWRQKHLVSFLFGPLTFGISLYAWATKGHG